MASRSDSVISILTGTGTTQETWGISSRSSEALIGSVFRRCPRSAKNLLVVASDSDSVRQLRDFPQDLILRSSAVCPDDVPQHLDAGAVDLVCAGQAEELVLLASDRALKLLLQGAAIDAD